MLLDRGTVAFDRIFARIAAARRSIVLRCFNWRTDPTGIAMGEALLKAADRGVKVTIFKDRVGAFYEYSEASRQSFFHQDVDLKVRVQAFLVMAAYGRMGSMRQAPSPVAAALVAHANVVVEHSRRRFDHAKVFLFDDEALILGGMGIGEEDRYHTVDFMVEVPDAEAVARYHDRCAERAQFDPARSLDFLVNSRAARDKGPCPLREQRLEILRSAERRLTVEMAYFEETCFAEVLADAVQRGVEVTLVTSEMANVLGHVNRQRCDLLLRLTDSAPNLRVVLHPRMIHSKVIVVDGHIVELGSANFTRISHGTYDETDLYVRDDTFAAGVEAAVQEHAAQGRRVTGRVPFSRLYATVERLIMAHQARH